MTIFEWLKRGQKQLKNSSTARLDSEILLSFLLKKPKSYLITHEQEQLQDRESKTYEAFLKERATGKPIAYITNSKEFYGKSFFVDERVLIPRPETEGMIEAALELIKRKPKKKTIVDLGTGSGIIAISIAQELPRQRVIGLDISRKALEVAMINQKKYPSKNLEFHLSDLLSISTSSEIINPNYPLIILANLPYIGITSNSEISEETKKHEPYVALYGGRDGLDLYRKTWKQIKEMELNISALFMEITATQTDLMTKEAKKEFPNMKFRIQNDLAGLPRLAILVE